MHTNTLQGFTIINFISIIVSTQLNVSKERSSHIFFIRIYLFSHFPKYDISRTKAKGEDIKVGSKSARSHVNIVFRSTDKLPVSDNPCGVLFTVIMAQRPCDTSRTPKKKWSDENILKTFLTLIPNRMKMKFSLASQVA